MGKPITMKPTRRQILTGTAGLALASNRVLRADPSSVESRAIALRELAKARKIMFGAAAVSDILRDDPKMREIYIEQTELIVPDYEMKWGEVRPAPDVFNFNGADQLANFAEDHNLQLRGHCLAWEESNPGWLETELTTSNAEHFLIDHIQRIVGRYAGRIHSWDVVNEPIWPDHDKPGGLRDGVWLETIGPRYIDIAFQTARAADPKAILVINEAGTETTAKRSQARRQHFLSLLDNLDDRGIPVDAVGLECHLSTSAEFAKDDFAEYLSNLASRGKKILITELDVSDKDVADSDISVRDHAVAELYEAVVSAAVKNANVIAILTWELSDRYSWLRDPDLESSLRRADGSPIRPLLYDDALKRKPSWWAVARAIS